MVTLRYWLSQSPCVFPTLFSITFYRWISFRFLVLYTPLFILGSIWILLQRFSRVPSLNSHKFKRVRCLTTPTLLILNNNVSLYAPGGFQLHLRQYFPPLYQLPYIQILLAPKTELFSFLMVDATQRVHICLQVLWSRVCSQA